MLNMRKKGGKDEYHYSRFKYCTKSDFERRGVDVDHEFEKEINKRLCPDISSDEDFYKVENSYTNLKLRHSFSVEIRKC